MSKTPERTAYWQRICNEAATVMLPKMQHGSYATFVANAAQLVEWVSQAETEGYDDTAQYLQHIIDDLTII